MLSFRRRQVLTSFLRTQELFDETTTTTMPATVVTSKRKVGMRHTALSHRILSLKTFSQRFQFPIESAYLVGTAHEHYLHTHKTQKHFRCSHTQIQRHTHTHIHLYLNIRIRKHSQRFYLIFNLITGKSLVDVDAVAVVCGEHSTYFVRIFCLFLRCIIYKIVCLCTALFISGVYSTKHFIQRGGGIHIS